MLIIQVSSASFDDALVNRECERLAKAFAAGATECSPSLPLTALVVQDHQGISNVAPADAPLCLLFIPKADSGSELEETNDVVEARIHDCINNLCFCISPTAFFRVIGVEMNASAVSNAHRNAEINGITNCRFVCTKAEDVMGSLLKEYLNAPQKQDDHASVSSDKEINTTEEKGSSADNVKNNEGDSGCDPENGIGASDCSESGGKEPESELLKNCTSDDGNSSMQQFKNVVAIVDPPRGGRIQVSSKF